MMNVLETMGLLFIYFFNNPIFVYLHHVYYKDYLENKIRKL